MRTISHIIEKCHHISADRKPLDFLILDSVYLYEAQCVVQVFADFLLLLLLLFFALGGILVVVVVHAEAEEDLHGAEAVVEVTETHLIETWKSRRH